MSIPVRVVVNWSVVKLCKKCADRLIAEIGDKIRSGSVTVDLPRLLCDDCWKYNINNGGIRLELDPGIVRS